MQLSQGTEELHRDTGLELPKSWGTLQPELKAWPFKINEMWLQLKHSSCSQNPSTPTTPLETAGKS